MSITVSARRVLTSGTIVAQKNDSISIEPFATDPQYKVDLILNFEATDEDGIKLIPAEDGRLGCTIYLNCSKETTEVSTSAPIVFAESKSANEEYVIDIATNRIGAIERFTKVIFYTISVQGLTS
ncbi:hypothetical protein [Bosea sp. AK1]|uniref:hypothetical protein n=1 Tax=Bosea sp. AK1 TaxID=2587160 RepID=UPI00114EC598|nr:hypothetical protein [Bosea sp. AK1]